MLYRFKFFCFLLVLMAHSFIAYGQQVSKYYRHPCAFDQNKEALFEKDPSLRKSYQQLNEEIERYTMQHAYDLRAGLTYTLPIVIHIITPPGTAIGQGNNLTDAEIYKGLAFLNDAFANRGMFNTASGVDVGIQFCMAVRDPQNKPTNGITRHESTLVSESNCSPYATDKDKDADLKKIVNWDCRSYINVWLVTDLYGFDFGCSLAGYAYFPGAPCSLDGIVQESRYWNSASGTEITAHEFGHYLNLNHTFFGGCTNTGNCLNDGDLVCDTPPDLGPGGSCTDNSCTFDVPDLPDDRQNYMDYYTCKPLHFTEGQRVRMEASLLTRRSSLISSLGCKPVAENDVAIFMDKALDCPSKVCPIIAIRNTGINAVNKVTIVYVIDGGANKIFNWVGSLMPDDTVYVNLPCEFTVEGLHTFDATATDVNGLPDAYPINNVINNFTLYSKSFNATFSTFPLSPLKYIFVAKSFGIASYKWNFGDGGTSILAQPTHTYAVKGNYTVSLEVTSLCGDKITHVQVIAASDICDIGWSPFFTDFGQVINPDVDICAYLQNGFFTNQYINVGPQEQPLGEFHFDFCDTICTGPGFTFRMNLRTVSSLVTNNSNLKTTIELKGNNQSMGVVLKDPKNRIDTTKIWAGSNNMDSLKALEVDLFSIKEIELKLVKDTFYFSYDNKKQEYQLPFDGRMCDLNQMAFTFSDKVWIDEITILDANGIVVYFENFIDCNFTNPASCNPIPLSATLAEVVGCDTISQELKVTGSIWPLIFEVEPTSLALPNRVYKYYNLAVGKYAIKVNAICPEDEVVVNFEVTKQPLADTLIGKEAVRCNRKGSIIVDGIGGTKPYQFQLNGGAWQSDNRFENLDAGLYTIIIRDAIGCERMITERIEDLNRNIVLQVDSLTTIPCNTLANGYAAIKATGSTPYYHYRLNGGPYQGYGIFEGLKPGVYTAEAIDDGGCTSQVVTFEIKIDEDYIVSSSSYAICKGEVLKIGTKSYNQAGIYNDTLVTASGCDSINKITITELIGPQFNQEAMICDNQNFTVGTNTYNVSGSYIDTLKSAKGCDSIVFTKLIVTKGKTTSQEASICEKESYKVGSSIYTKAGIYKDTLQSKLGCDSIVTTDLKVLNIKSKSQSISICDNDSYNIGNSTYTIAGSYRDTLMTNSGCDSIVTTMLSVINPKTKNQKAAICVNQTFKVGNKFYASSGIYIDTLNSINGCDSIITTDLIVLKTALSNQKISLCERDTFSIGGKDYTTSGLYIDTLKNTLGCDSIVATDLSFVRQIKTNQNVNICEGQPLIIGNQSISTPGIYQDTIASAAGCDSVVSYYVTVFNKSLSAVTKSICNGTAIDFGGMSFTSAGLYFDTLKNQYLCDSIVTLDLKVLDTFNVNKYYSICNGEVITIDGKPYNKDGIYPAFYKTSAGCDSTVLINISYTDEPIKCDSFACLTHVPNILSNSETNNGFTVISKNMAFGSLEIFDRWGNKMFYTNDASVAWNGRAPSGSNVVPGVYVYLIKGVCNDGKPYIKYGDLTVVR